MRDCADFVSDLGEVLILTEDDGDVELASVGAADDVERDANVDALLFAGTRNDWRAVGKDDRLVAVPERTSDHLYASAPHRRDLLLPEVVPRGLVDFAGETGVELN